MPSAVHLFNPFTTDERIATQQSSIGVSVVRTKKYRNTIYG